MMTTIDNHPEAEPGRERPWDRDAILRLLDDLAVHILYPHRDRICIIRLRLVGFCSFGSRDFFGIEVWADRSEGAAGPVDVRALAQEAEALFMRQEPGSRFHHDNSRDQSIVAQSRLMRAKEISAHRALQAARRLRAG